MEYSQLSSLPPPCVVAALSRRSYLGRALPWTGALLAIALVGAPAADAASESFKLSRENCDKLIHGKIAKVDQTGAIAISYDFEKGATKDDFLGLSSGAPKTGPLAPRTPDDEIWHKADFEGDIALDMQITTSGGEGWVFLLVNPEADEGYVFLFGGETRSGASYTAIGKYRKGNRPDIISQGLRAPWKAGSYTLSVSRKGEELQLKIGKQVLVKAKDKTYRGGKIGISGDLSVARLDIQSKLNLRWCEKTLSAGPDAPKKERMTDEEFLEELFRRLGVEADYELKDPKPSWPSPATKETDHYIITTDMEQKQADHYARCAEAMYAMYSKVFPAPKDAAPKATIYVFKTRDGFIKFGAPANVYGFFMPSNGNIYLYDHVKIELTYQVLLHEGFHQYLNLLVKDAPIWFHEGMAQYFETATLKGAQFTVGATNLCLRHLAALAERNRLCALPEFLRIDRKKFQDDLTVGENYTYAWGLAHFLLHYKNGAYRKSLVNYFLALQKGASPEPALKEAFAGVNWDKAKTQWTAYIKELYKK